MRYPKRSLTTWQYAQCHASLDRMQIELQKLLHEADMDSHLFRHAKRALTATGRLSWILCTAGYQDKETSE